MRWHKPTQHTQKKLNYSSFDLNLLTLKLTISANRFFPHKFLFFPLIPADFIDSESPEFKTPLFIITFVSEMDKLMIA